MYMHELYKINFVNISNTFANSLKRFYHRAKHFKSIINENIDPHDIYITQN